MKTTLTEDEFAINADASSENIKIDAKSAKLSFTKTGSDSVSMTLSMPFEIDLNKIQRGPGPIRFENCAVHVFENPNLIEGQFKDLILSILEGTESIIIQSIGNDIAVLTNGTKGEHGNHLF